jgi:hypothetical protein
MRSSRICATKAPCGELFFRLLLAADAVLDNPETVFPSVRDRFFRAEMESPDSHLMCRIGRR